MESNERRDFRVVFVELEKLTRERGAVHEVAERTEMQEAEEIRQLREIVSQITEAPRIYFTRT